MFYLPASASPDRCQKEAEHSHCRRSPASLRQVVFWTRSHPPRRSGSRSSDAVPRFRAMGGCHRGGQRGSSHGATFVQNTVLKKSLQCPPILKETRRRGVVSPLGSFARSLASTSVNKPWSELFFYYAAYKWPY